MVIRGRDALRVIIEQARHEGAYHEIVPLESLVHRRGLVDPPGDRLEVVDAEDPGIQITIPANHVERVVVQDVPGEAVAHFHPHLEFAPLGVRLQLLRRANVALAVRGVLEKLPVLIPVAGGGSI